MAGDLTPYELKALEGIKAFKAQKIEKGKGSIFDLKNKTLKKIENMVLDNTRVQWVVDKTVGALLHSLNDLAHWSVRPQKIHEDFRKKGFDVHGPEDIGRLNLEDVDQVIGRMGVKYKTLAAVEGAATGLGGLIGIPADVVAIVALNQRSIAEYATHCGFDVNLPVERLFALNILGLASSSEEDSRKIALAHLMRIAQQVTAKRSWKNLERGVMLGAVQKAAQVLGVRLTEAKLLQWLPAVGAGVGAVFNLAYTTRISEAAWFLYRERFLASKYGPELIRSSDPPRSEEV